MSIRSTANVIPWAEAQAEWETFQAALAGAMKAGREPVLMLDYDGTLAPFRVDRFQAHPWVGVPELIEQIRTAGTRVVMVTGRPARELRDLLRLDPVPEIWGLHGAEQLRENGELVPEVLDAGKAQLLEDARKRVISACEGFRLEHKPNAVLVHWRGEPARRAEMARQAAMKIFAPLDGKLELMEFEGGLELRAGRDKGDVVRFWRAHVGTGVPIAFLGDERTDEAAFRVMRKDDGPSLSVLVRRAARPTDATVWLKPPGELRMFLRKWLSAVSARG